MRPRPTRLAVATGLASAGLALAACGGGGGGSSSSPSSSGSSGTKSTSSGSAGGGKSISLSADPSGQLKYDTKSLSAAAGEDTINFDNPSATPHDVTIATEGGKVLGQTKIVQSGKATASVNLKPGTYVFYCSVDAHRQAGMQGKLTVK